MIDNEDKTKLEGWVIKNENTYHPTKVSTIKFPTNGERLIQQMKVFSSNTV